MKITKHIKNKLKQIHPSIKQNQETNKTDKNKDTDRHQTKTEIGIDEVREKIEEQKQQIKDELEQIYKN